MILYCTVKKRDNEAYFFCGNTDLSKLSGEGWDDVPYEVFAKKPDQGLINHVYWFKFKPSVYLLEPKEWNDNIESPFTMHNIVQQHYPILLVLPKNLVELRHKPIYSEWNESDNPNVCKLHIGDEIPMSSPFMDYAEAFQRSVC